MNTLTIFYRTPKKKVLYVIRILVYYTVNSTDNFYNIYLASLKYTAAIYVISY